MENLIIVLVAMLSGVTTYVISNILNKGAIFASASVTLISGIILPHFFPVMGTTLMVVAACASYAGMVSIKHVPNLWEMMILSTITGILFIVSTQAYVGVGGKLGTIAALSCFSWTGLKRLVSTATSTKTDKYLFKSFGIKYK